MAEVEKQQIVDKEAPRVEAPAGAQILEFKRPQEPNAVDKESEATYRAIAEAAQLDQLETEIFVEAAKDTGDAEMAFRRAYEGTKIDRRAAIVSVLLATGINENRAQADLAFRELQAFATGNKSNVVDINKAQTDPEAAIRHGIAGATSRVREMGDAELAEIETELPELSRLLELLGVDGNALMTHIIASPEQAAGEVAKILTSFMAPGSKFTSETTITGVNPQTVELMAPWKTMREAARSFSTNNAPRIAA